MIESRHVLKRKSMLIDQRKLDIAMKALGAESEAATVDAALDLIAFPAEVFEALDRLAALPGRALFGPTATPRRRRA